MSARSPSFIESLISIIGVPLLQIFPLLRLVWFVSFTPIYDIREDSLFDVYLCGQHLHVTPDYVARAFGIPWVPNPEYPFSAATAPTGSMLMSCIHL